MSDVVDCPYCERLFAYEGDQDSEQEFTCPHCDGTCVANVYWSLNIHNERKKDSAQESK